MRRWISLAPAARMICDDLPAGRAAHDGVVHQDHPFALKYLPDRVQFHLDAEVPDRLLGFDERAADVVVADQPELQRDAALVGIADGRRDAGVGHRHDDVGLDGVLARQVHPHEAAARVDGPAEHETVGAAEIDVLEDAVGRLFLRQREAGLDVVRVDHQHLARLDVADVAGVNEVEGAGLGGHHVTAADLAEAQRPEAVRVARHEQEFRGEEQNGVRALDDPQRIDEGVEQGAPLGAREQVQDDFAVAGRVEDGAVALQFAAQLGGVDQVAVVRERQRARASSRSGSAGRWRRSSPRPSNNARGRWPCFPAAAPGATG